MQILISAIALGAASIPTQVPASTSDAAAHQPDLTRDQALERADQLFNRFDVNHDGVVTRDEAQQVGTKLRMQRTATGRDSAPGLGGHTLRFLEHRFAGVDAVTRKDFEEAMLAHFDAMDTNHDGILTAAERAGGRTGRPR